MLMQVDIKYHKVSEKKKHDLPDAIQDVKHIGLTEYDSFIYIERNNGEVRYINAGLISMINGKPVESALKAV